MTEYQDYGYKNDAPNHIFNYVQANLLAMLNNKKNRVIIDLGCGNGYLVNYLLANGYQAYGTDASNEGITIAQKTNPAHFFLQDLATGKLPEELQNFKFDTIVSTEVIEHLYNPQQFISFCKDILGDKGELIITTPYHGYIKNLVLALFNKWDAHLSPLWQGGHIKMWSRSTLTELLAQGGFKVTAFKGCGRMPYLWKSMMIKAELL